MTEKSGCYGPSFTYTHAQTYLSYNLSHWGDTQNHDICGMCLLFSVPIFVSPLPLSLISFVARIQVGVGLTLLVVVFQRGMCTWHMGWFWGSNSGLFTPTGLAITIGFFLGLHLPSSEVEVNGHRAEGKLLSENWEYCPSFPDFWRVFLELSSTTSPPTPNLVQPGGVTECPSIPLQCQPQTCQTLPSRFRPKQIKWEVNDGEVLGFGAILGEQTSIQGDIALGILDTAQLGQHVVKTVSKEMVLAGDERSSSKIQTWDHPFILNWVSYGMI